MRNTHLPSVSSIALLIVLLWLPPTMVVAQAQQETSNSWVMPRTSDGQPDIQGTWANNSATPLERPEILGDKATLSEEEVAELARLVEEFRDGEQAGDLLGDRLIQQALGNAEFQDFDVITGNYNAFWLVEREVDNRTSLISNPSNGRIPPLTSEAQQRSAERQVYAREHPSDGPENRTLSDRCLHFGSPRMGAGYNSYFQILQTSGYVGILQEMGHQSRTVPLDGRPHLDELIRQWGGDSRGRWEGDTLVVETTNYSPKSGYSGSSKNLTLVERYTLVSADTLRHEITLEDSTTWTQPWTVVLLLKKTDDPLFEYACHEGNYAMEGILAGARAEERAASNAAKNER